MDEEAAKQANDDRRLKGVGKGYPWRVRQTQAVPEPRHLPKARPPAEGDVPKAPGVHEPKAGGADLSKGSTKGSAEPEGVPEGKGSATKGSGKTSTASPTEDGSKGSADKGALEAY